MQHYICTGSCAGVAEHPGVCKAEDCEQYQKQLELCDCTDGKHGGAFDVVTGEEEEE